LPQKAAGMRTLPAPSVPTASGPMPAATAAAALPPEEPPGVLARFQGLRVRPVSGELVSPLQPNSGVAVLPSSTAPDSRRRATAGASTSQGWSGSTVRLPRRVGQPRVRMRSLIDTGTPSSGPSVAPACQRAVLSRAAASAESCATRQKAFSSGFSASMRASTACVASSGEASPRGRAPAVGWRCSPPGRSGGWASGSPGAVHTADQRASSGQGQTVKTGDCPEPRLRHHAPSTAGGPR
jgi:hypothetical protein